MAYTFINPYIIMSVLGVAYSMLAASLWPMVSLVVPDHQLGTAYGFMQALQNLGLALVSLAAGILVETKVPVTPF
jgi:MFS family permease